MGLPPFLFNYRTMEKEIYEICNIHNLGTILSFQTIKEGVLNENYIVNTTKETFFLKRCKNKSSEQIKYIWQVEQFMRKALIPAVEAVIIDEEKGWMIYPFVQSDRSHSYDLKDYFIMGQMLGRIHMVSYGIEIPHYFKESFYRENIDRVSVTEKMKDHAKRIKQKETIDETDKLFLSYIDRKIIYAKKFDNILLPANDTLIHGDFHPGNLLIDENSRDVIGVCDWEKTRYAPRSYDLARAYLYIGFGTDTDDTKECFEISESFLNGYRSVIQISDEDFKKGLLLRLQHNVFTSWIEDKYYLQDDSRANKFIKNSILTLDYFLGHN